MSLGSLCWFLYWCRNYVWRALPHWVPHSFYLLMSHYQIEYYNKIWRDWLAFDQKFYQTKEQAKKQAETYKQQHPKFETRIIQTTILDEKPRRTRKRNLETKVSSEKIR